MVALELFNKAVSDIGGTEEFIRKHGQYSESVAYIDNHRLEILKKYDNQWIVVYNSKLVGHGEKYADVTRIVERKGLPMDDVVIKHVSNKKVMTLF